MSRTARLWVTAALIVPVMLPGAGCATDFEIRVDPALTPVSPGDAATDDAAVDGAAADDAAVDGASVPEEARNPGGYDAYGVYERVSFEAGASETTVEAAVVRGTVNGHLVEAAADQIMKLELTSTEGNARLEVFGPDDDLLAQGLTAMQVPTDGEYLIVVSSDRGNATYTLRIEIR